MLLFPNNAPKMFFTKILILLCFCATTIIITNTYILFLNKSNLKSSLHGKINLKSSQSLKMEKSHQQQPLGKNAMLKIRGAVALPLLI